MTVSDRRHLVERLKAALLERPEILEAYLFGSRARADENAQSDVDVAVYLDKYFVSSSPFGYRAEISSQLARSLRIDDVDVVVLNDAPPLLYHRVLRDGVRLFARDPAATTTREGRALSRYCDYVPHLRKVEAAHKARIAAGQFGR